MRLEMFGSDHHLAPPSRMRALTVRTEPIRAMLARLQREGVISGSVLIETCNRFEVLVEAPAPTKAGAPDDLAALVLGTDHGVPLHRHKNVDAIAHLLCVATGLESMVIGEEQVLGQVRRAFQEAEEARLLSRGLHMLWTRVIAAARELRSRCDLCGGQPSVASVAAGRLAQAGARLAVVGTGETGRQALEFLTRHGVRNPVVVNRTRARAEALAAHFGGTAQGLDDFLSDPPELDGVLFAVRGGKLALRPDTASVLIDVSQPSVLPDDLRSHPELTVLDLDDVAGLAAVENARRQQAADDERELVPGHAERIFSEVSEKRAEIGKLVDLHVENALAEVDRALHGKLSHLSDTDRDLFRDLVLRAAKRHAHLHIKDVKLLSAG
ncbi:MAG: hypothetical protein CMJ85_07550 [Planctomycetes bacterium]|nr:hypothetical protein [Planctomycetota bacterium]